jgi:hypothetical protein
VDVTDGGGLFLSSLNDFRLLMDRSIGHSSTVLLGNLRESEDELMATRGSCDMTESSCNSLPCGMALLYVSDCRE